MAISLNDFCAEVNNYFDRNQRWFGVFAIENGSLDLSAVGIADGQYFRIVGSTFNDGVYCYPTTELKDEIFDGAVWLMAVPSEVHALLEDINVWYEKFGKVDGQANSPFTSESYSGYSYSKDRTEGADAGSWQGAFKNRLNRFRKLSAI